MKQRKQRTMHVCIRCGYEWYGIVEAKKCAGCGTPLWNKPYERNMKKKRAPQTGDAAAERGVPVV